MGTIERIRQASPYVFAFFGVMLVAFFTIGDQTVVSGLLGSKNNSADKPIAIIDGEEIAYRDYAGMLQQQTENQRRQNPDQEINDLQLKRQVWQTIIDQKILEIQAEKAGITVTDAEIRDQLLNNPPDFLKKQFSDSLGNFDQRSYLDIITNPEIIISRLPEEMSYEEKEAQVNRFRADILGIQDYLLKQKMSNNLSSIVSTTGSVISPEFAKEKYLAENSSASVNYIDLSIRNIANKDVTVSDEEIKAYYDAHKENFKQDAKKQVSYVTFRMIPSHKDTLKAQKAIQEIMNTFSKAQTADEKDNAFDQMWSKYNGEPHDFTLVNEIDQRVSNFVLSLAERQVAGPFTLADGTYFFRLDARREGDNEVVKASHILINANDNNLDSAKAEADKILKKAKAGEDFAELAKKHSEDPGSKTRGGDLGYFGKGRMVPEFDKACFSNNVGDIVGPIKTQFGYHIIKIVDKKSEEIKYSEIKIAPHMSTSTRNLLMRDAQIMAKQAAEEGISLDTLAARKGLRATTPGFFEKEKPILGSQYLTDKAFELEVGSVIEPIELDYYGLIVAQVTGSKAEGIASLDDKKDEIKRKLTDEKKLDALKAQAEQMYAKIKAAGSFAAAKEQDPTIDVKTIDNLKNDGKVSGYSSEPAFTAYAFNQPVNKVLGPIRGEQAYFIIEVTNRNIPSKEDVEANLASYIETLKQQSSGITFYQWINAIKEQSNIEDFRKDFYREY